MDPYSYNHNVLYNYKTGKNEALGYYGATSIDSSIKYPGFKIRP
jgi:hypothetical protein